MEIRIVTSARKLYHERYPNGHIPHHPIFANLNRRLCETGFFLVYVTPFPSVEDLIIRISIVAERICGMPELFQNVRDSMQGVASSIGASPTLLFTPSFMVQNRCLSDKCTWPCGHCLLFDLGKAPISRLSVIMVKGELEPIDYRRREESPEKKRLGRWRIEIGAEREERPWTPVALEDWNPWFREMSKCISEKD
ncbi:hypothetical protein TNCV_4358941 [Trichonephila clavipes]|nr:hypothetical protein TNCV_4358941 [Trichonephila clavipes]